MFASKQCNNSCQFSRFIKKKWYFWMTGNMTFFNLNWFILDSQDFLKTITDSKIGLTWKNMEPYLVKKNAYKKNKLVSITLQQNKSMSLVNSLNDQAI